VARWSTALAPARVALRQFTTNLLRATDGRDVLLNSPDGWEVEQPWLFWTGPGNGTLGPFGHPIPGANGTGYGALPAVARATGLIVDTLATLPWHVYRDETERLPTPDWIADPQALRLDGRIVDDAGMVEARWSRVDFWGQWLQSALWYGDGFVYVPTRDSFGYPKPPLWILHPYDVELRNDSYWVSDIELPAGSVIHLRGQLPIVDGRGTGVLTRFTSDLSMAVALRDYAAGAFTAGVPAGYLKTSTPNISQEQADALKTRWLSQHGNTRRSIAVLNATTEFHPLTWSPVDLAATEFARITLGQIALMFGVPAYLLGAPTDSNTYANVENRMLELYQLTLLPWIGRAESVLDAQLARGTELRIEIDGLLRADTKTRMESYDIALRNGILTVDEVRALEARPPMPQTEGAL
jgi:HK97 family phage portal protein